MELQMPIHHLLHHWDMLFDSFPEFTILKSA
jgi:hypothetical protein